MNAPNTDERPDPRHRTGLREPVLEVVPATRAAPPVAVAAARLTQARSAYVTRRVELSHATQQLQLARPMAGDLVLARVESIGQHARIELHSGRRAALYAGDEIVVAFGARYAPDQFEAVVPDDLGPCDLVAAGGIAARVLSRHGKVAKATRIAPIGLLADAQGRPLNLSQFALQDIEPPTSRPVVIAVAGTTMNSGKTTTAAGLIHGLARAGLRVGAAKVTGTGAGGDTWSMLDAGAAAVLDFTDMGYATTAGLGVRALERVATGLIHHLIARKAEIIVIEIADGVLQKETGALLQSTVLRQHIDGLLFAAGDAMGAIGGVEWLRRHQVPVLGVSGLISVSPLAAREAESALGMRVIDLPTLMNAEAAPKLCFSCPAPYGLGLTQ